MCHDWRFSLGNRISVEVCHCCLGTARRFQRSRVSTATSKWTFPSIGSLDWNPPRVLMKTTAVLYYHWGFAIKNRKRVSFSAEINKNDHLMHSANSSIRILIDRGQLRKKISIILRVMKQLYRHQLFPENYSDIFTLIN